MIHTHAKDQGQRSLSSKVTVETDRWMESIALSYTFSSGLIPQFSGG